MTKYMLTAEGRRKVRTFISECKAKQKELLDSGRDTVTDVNIPTAADILADIEWMGIDEDGEYYNAWGVSDNYESDRPLSLKLDIDFVEENK